MPRFIFETNFFTNTSTAQGNNTRADGLVSHAEGIDTIAKGVASHAEGSCTKAYGLAAHSEGTSTTAGSPDNSSVYNSASHAEGYGTSATGQGAHAEGYDTIAEGEGSHSEGWETIANNLASHAEGFQTTASGQVSHAEGNITSATGLAAHAEGFQTLASNYGSHSEGYLSTASGNYSHAEGSETVASGECSHAEGNNTSTDGYEGAHIIGQYGDATEAYSWFIANGTDYESRGLGAKWLSSNRCMFIDGPTYFAGGADYAEMFETLDGQPIDYGYFVTLEGEKIRKANSNDRYILGVISSTPSVVGDSAEFGWDSRYVTDEWGQVQKHEVTIPAVIRDGKEIVPEHTVTQPVYNPEWDKSKEYVSRLLRPEWAAVGLLGKIKVRHDGSCQVNGFCWPNDEGIATAAESGYRVIKSSGPNQVTVLFK